VVCVVGCIIGDVVASVVGAVAGLVVGGAAGFRSAGGTGAVFGFVVGCVVEPGVVCLGWAGVFEPVVPVGGWVACAVIVVGFVPVPVPCLGCVGVPDSVVLDVVCLFCPAGCVVCAVGGVDCPVCVVCAIVVLGFVPVWVLVPAPCFGCVVVAVGGAASDVGTWPGPDVGATDVIGDVAGFRSAGGTGAVFGRGSPVTVMISVVGCPPGVVGGLWVVSVNVSVFGSVADGWIVAPVTEVVPVTCGPVFSLVVWACAVTADARIVDAMSHFLTARPFLIGVRWQCHRQAGFMNW
jgi:hypothetical protein